MRKSVVCLVLLASAWAQEPAFRADVSLVEIDAQVLDKAGVVEGLQAADFVITDNKSPARVRFCRQEETPLELVLLFEFSKFMRPRLGQIQVAAEMAMAELREGDRVAVMPFNDKPRVEIPFTADLKEAKRRIRIGLANASFSQNLPNVLAAAEASARLLSEQPKPHGQQVVLMFTSDLGSGMKQGSDMAVANRFEAEGAFLSAMVIPNSLTRFTHDDNPLHFWLLQQLGIVLNFNATDSIEGVAEQSGGEVLFANDSGFARGASNASAALRQMIRHMRKRYRLYYDIAAGKPGEHRQVEVRLSAEARSLYPDARAIAQKGYTMPAQKPR